MPAQRWRRVVAPGSLLLAVCVLHGLSSLVAVGVHHQVGGDESVYLSQINRFVPAGLFTAPRARGLTLLVAPVTLLTPSIVVLRLWLAAVSSALMFVCFRPWLRLVPPYVVPLAAFMFSSLWTTIYYGYAAMPNLYVALGAVAATGLLVAQLREPTWRRLVWLAVTVALLGLLRPPDAAFVVVALLACTVALRSAATVVRWRAAVALVAGFAVGVAEWVVEAYARFGGVAERLHLAQAEQGPPGLHFSLLAQARTLAGPLLCRDGCHVGAPMWAVAWWFVVPGLVAAGIWAAPRSTRTAYATATVAGLAVMAEYVVSVPYGAPRFLLPTYALVFLPAAAGLIAVGARVRRSWRPVAVAVAGSAVALQAAGQLVVLRGHVVPYVDRNLAINTDLARALRPDLIPGHCVLDGPRGGQVAYLDGCEHTTKAAAVARASESGTSSGLYVDRTRRGPLPRPLTGWSLVPVRPPGLDHTWYVALDRDTVTDAGRG